jgi:diguanylate cyclase (GGDEF)-like protein
VSEGETIREGANSAWLRYLTAGAVLAAIYFAIPHAGSGIVLRVVLYVVISASAPLAVVVGVARNGPRPALPWLLIGAGQAVYALADATFYIDHYLRDDRTYPATADVLYLLHYPLLAAGLIVLIRRRSPRRDVPALLDAACVAVVAGMLSRVYLMAPLVEAHRPLLVEATSLAYPVLDLATLVVAIRLVLGGGPRPTAYFLLLGSLVAILTADTIYIVQLLSSDYAGAGSYLDAIWLLSNLLIGAAALHPTMRAMSEQADGPPDALTLPRLAALCVAALVAPVTLWVQDLRGDLSQVSAIALACALLFVLTIARLAVLVVEQRRLAITDSLTGVHTRRFLEAQLLAEVTRAQRDGGAVALCIIDVDRFKTVNDSFGHPAGDRALVEIARRLRLGSRSADLLVRYGGEEFALLMPGARADQLVPVAERLRAEVARTPVPLAPDTCVALTVSIGAAGYPQHGRSPAELIEAADRALYTAKENGRDRIVVGPA